MAILKDRYTLYGIAARFGLRHCYGAINLFNVHRLIYNDTGGHAQQRPTNNVVYGRGKWQL